MSARLPLIVTRPDPGSAATVEQAQARGINALAMPLFAARACSWTAPDSKDFEALLLTSANAPRLAGTGLSALADLPTYVVGTATGAAAEAAGLRVMLIGSGHGQSLVDSMTSQGIRSILWLCGRDRSNLDLRGASITEVPVYGVDPVAPPAEWTAMIAAPAVVMAYSKRAATRIDTLTGAARKHLTLLAISAPVADAAGRGWDKIVIAARADDAAMLAEAYALCHKVE